MQNLILIKLGGSVITDKDKSLTSRIDVIKRLAFEITKAKKENQSDIYIISHGSGSFGHSVAKQNNFDENFILDESNNFAVSSIQYSAMLLHRIVLLSFLEKEQNIFSISPSSCITQNQKGDLEFNSAILERSLEKGFMPISYGDVIFDEVKGAKILSTEELLLLFAKKLNKKYKIKKIITITDEDGIYKNIEKKEIYKTITKEDKSEVEKNIYDTSAKDVTGGMMQKLDYGFKFAEIGIPMLVVNGNVEGRIYNCLSEEDALGTLINM